MGGGRGMGSPRLLTNKKLCKIMSVLNMPIKFLVMIFNFEGSRAENAGFIMFLIYNINKVAFFGFSNLISEVSS